MKFRYRLKREYWKHDDHKQWRTAHSEEEKKRIEKNSPRRFDFEVLENSIVPDIAIIKEEPKKAKRGRTKAAQEEKTDKK